MRCAHEDREIANVDVGGEESLEAERRYDGE